MAKQVKEAPFVEVLWTDAVIHSGWVSDPKSCKPVQVTQRGWLLESNQDYIVISMSKPDGPSDYLGVQTIPQGMVENWWEIEVETT